MSFSASSWAIKNPTLPVVFFLVMTLAGLWAYGQMPVNNMPAVVAPVVTVTITQPGALPTGIETQITRKVESALAGLNGVKHLSSEITPGASVTTIEFYLGTDFDSAVGDARDAIANIRDTLPKTILEPAIQRVEFDSDPILTYSVSGERMQATDISWFVDDRITRDLLSIHGVGKVMRKGGTDSEVTVSLRPDQLNFYSITAQDVSHQLAMSNVDLPGGRMTVNGQEHIIGTLAGAARVQDLGTLPVSLGNGRTVRLSQLGDVSEGSGEVRSSAHIDGEPTVIFEVYRSKGASEVDVARQVDARLAELAAKFPDIHTRKLFSLASYTEASFHSALYAFFEGTILTIAVVFLALRNRRPTIIAAIAIPLSIIPTFLFMHWFGFTLNSVSLLAISLVTGVLVDDAIVEIENIDRHILTGENPYNAALIASDEIGMAVVATTLAICAVFLPVSFMNGVPAQYFRQFGITVAVSAFFSLLVARLITPVLAAYWLRASSGEAPQDFFLLQRYKRLIAWTLSNRPVALGIALLSMLLSFSLAPLLSTGFRPYEDHAHSTLQLVMPQGTRLAETDRAAQRVTEILHRHPEVQFVLTEIDGSLGGVNRATLDIKLTPSQARKLSARAFERTVLPELKKLPDMQLGFLNNDGDKDVSIALLGDDIAQLKITAAALEQQMRALPDLQSVSSTISQPQPEIIIKPDFTRAATSGITADQINQAVRVAMIGDELSNLPSFRTDNRLIPLRVRLQQADYPDLGVIETLRIPTDRGGAVPLKTIAAISYGAGPTSIERYDRRNSILVEANLNGVGLGDALKQIHALPALAKLPPGIEAQNMGDSDVMAELFATFTKAIIAGLCFVYAIQVVLYKNWLQPLTRMAALPLSVGGALIALLITGNDLNLPSVIGLLMLIGISDKNSILLVDCIFDQQQQGLRGSEAIVTACELRYRPIVMTSLAMLAGMLPLALGLGGESTFRIPMAIAVSGGIISSTVLSLVFVPVLFSYMSEFESFFIPRLKAAFR